MSEQKGRQAFTVDYIRHDNGNSWQASIKPRPGLEEANFVGFVSYSTARWEGQNESDERQASVTVIVECDLAPESRLPSIKDAVQKASKMADGYFKERHPLASISYSEFDPAEHF